MSITSSACLAGPKLKPWRRPAQIRSGGLCSDYAPCRRQRAAILSNALRELDGFRLAVDRCSVGCRGERAYLIAELATWFSANTTVREVPLNSHASLAMSFNFAGTAARRREWQVRESPC